jgi:hypothetical protein
MDEFRSITMREWQEQAEAQSKHESVIGSGEGEFRRLLAKFGFHLVSSACPKTTALECLQTIDSGRSKFESQGRPKTDDFGHDSGY